MNSVLINNVSRRYEAVVALDNVSVEINAGELFGFIGPDGAGKTTLLRILATLLKPDSGTAEVAGMDVVQSYKALRQHIGYMPGRFSLYQDLTVEENLRFFASVFGTSIDENYDLVKDIYDQIAPFSDRLAGQLSGGMKQKLALSCALIHRPKVLLLDEPTTGVDAVSRKEFWEMLQNIRRSGITVVVSTPYMDEARLCDRVALIQQGRFLAIDSPHNIESSYDRPILAVKSARKHDLILALRQYPTARSVYAFGEFAHLTVDTPTADIQSVSRFLANAGFDDAVVRDSRPGIEDVFMALMQ